MARPLRQPPSVKELQDPKAQEYWRQDVYNHLKLVGSITVDLPLLHTGDTTTFTIPVPGCMPDKGQTVHLGPPAGASPDLFWIGAVTAAGTVTVTIYNTTAGDVDPAPGLWGCRVMP